MTTEPTASPFIDLCKNGHKAEPRERSDGWVYCSRCGTRLYKGRGK